MGRLTRNKCIAMYLAGTSQADIAAETGLTMDRVREYLEDAGAVRRRHFVVKGPEEVFTREDVLRYRIDHPPGSVVIDEDGKRHEVELSFHNVCRTKDGRNYQWVELARVAWRTKRGMEPKCYYDSGDPVPKEDRE